MSKKEVAKKFEEYVKGVKVRATDKIQHGGIIRQKDEVFEYNGIIKDGKFPLVLEVLDTSFVSQFEKNKKKASTAGTTQFEQGDLAEQESVSEAPIAKPVVKKAVAKKATAKKAPAKKTFAGL